MCREGTFVSISEAARLLETTGTRILMMLKKQELAGRQVDGGWMIEKTSLQLCGRPKAADIVRNSGCGGGCGSGCGGH